MLVTQGSHATRPQTKRTQVAPFPLSTQLNAMPTPIFYAARDVFKGYCLKNNIAQPDSWQYSDSRSEKDDLVHLGRIPVGTALVVQNSNKKVSYFYKTRRGASIVIGNTFS